MSDQPILRVIAKMFIPFLMLFALYVQFHGDFGPGGGFQAGVIFAAALVLYALIFGTEQAKHVAHPRALQGCPELGWATTAKGRLFLAHGAFVLLCALPPWA